MKIRIILVGMSASFLMAQAPEGWFRKDFLGSDAARWWGAGIWAGEGHGSPAPLVDSLGMGNGLAGTGFHLEGGLRNGRLDVAAEVLGVRDPSGRASLTLFRGHVWWRGRSGWQGGFEEEPLVWGYGLKGGYVLGEAARPVPKLRIASPMAHLGIGRVSLGTWGFQTFLGKLENGRILSQSVQDRSLRIRTIQSSGDPQAPWLSGFRVQAEFGKLTEFYANYINLFAGSLRGRGMTGGYGLGDYATAVFGLKDALAESNIDFTDPNHPQGAYVNNALSASEADIGVRVRVPFLERALGARDARLYCSRGSKGVTMTYGLFFKRPFYWLAKDMERDLRDLARGRVGDFWNQNQRKAVPNLVVPNDTFGLLVAWEDLRLGFEYQDTVNTAALGHKAFLSSNYPTGFYRYGDPLGTALGGETRNVTVRLEAACGHGVTGTAWLLAGERPFRDDPTLWGQDHPGAQPGTDRFVGAQGAVGLDLGGGRTLDLGASWLRHGAVDYMAGRTGNGFRWYADLAWRWPGGRR